MELHYTLIDPTGNITILVTTPVPRAMHAQTAGKLLQREDTAEQVAFLEPSGTCPARLQMMGGEFCGNATMGLGAWLCRQDELPLGETAQLLLEVSGADTPVPCAITPVRTCYLGTVSMPLPQKIEEMTFPGSGEALMLPVVSLPGICHIIAPTGTVQRHQAEELLRRWAEELPDRAVGLLLLDEERMHFDPLVYVKDTDTMVWERCCGSGSAAIGAWLTQRRGSGQCLSLHQSGGTIAVVTVWNGQSLSDLTISGTVTIGKEKTIDLVF
jgi:diaminopimelate epimerase